MTAPVVAAGPPAADREAAQSAGEPIVRRGGGRRMRARLAAVQALYQLELNPDRDPESVVREFARHRLGRAVDEANYGDADVALFTNVVLGASAERERLDEVIAAALTEAWPLRRLEAVLRAILRAGAFEIAHCPDVPPRVVISEYTAIAHAFFAGKEPGLANGVLDRLGRTLRAAEM